MNVPQLRFKGFNEEWQSKKIKDIANIKTGGTPSTKIYDYWNPSEIDWMASGEVNKRYIFNTDKKISKKGLQESSAKIVKNNSVLIALAGQGKTRAKVAINKKEIAINQSLAAIELNDNYNYLFVFFNLDKRYLELRNLSSGDSGRGGLNKKLVKNITINIPNNIQEQRKIGTFFNKLDDLITKQTQKVALLKQLKRGYLQKLFPQAGQTTPQLRFKGFNDEWQSKKLGDFLSIPIKEKANINSINDLITVRLNLNGVVLSDRATLSLTATNYYIRHSGQFIYGKQNFFNGAIAIIPKEFEGKATSGDVPALDIKNIDSMFLYFFVSRPTYFKNKKSMASGTGSKRIHEKTLLSFNIAVPNSLQEQQKISSLFAKLDHLIELQNHRLKLLEELKKGYLQKMFI